MATRKKPDGLKKKLAAQAKKDKAPAKPSDYNGVHRKKNLAKGEESLKRQEKAAAARKKSGKIDVLANVDLSMTKKQLAYNRAKDSEIQKKDDAAKQKKVAARKKAIADRSSARTKRSAKKK